MLYCVFKCKQCREIFYKSVRPKEKNGVKCPNCGGDVEERSHGIITAGGCLPVVKRPF